MEQPSLADFLRDPEERVRIDAALRLVAQAESYFRVLASTLRNITAREIQNIEMARDIVSTQMVSEECVSWISELTRHLSQERNRPVVEPMAEALETPAADVVMH